MWICEQSAVFMVDMKHEGSDTAAIGVKVRGCPNYDVRWINSSCVGHKNPCNVNPNCGPEVTYGLQCSIRTFSHIHCVQVTTVSILM
jgi:uncharacterized Zn-binding protein involved in type VI secretion